MGKSFKKTAMAAWVAIFSLSHLQLALADTKFDGFYIGVHAGYLDAKDIGKEYANGTFDNWTQKTNIDGGLLGAYAGYNNVFENNLLLGLQAEYEYRDVSDTSFQKLNGVPDPNFAIKTKLKDAGAILAKLGYVFNSGQTLAYATAGYATTNVKRTFIDTTTPASLSITKRHDGWTAGLGVEHFFFDNVSVKAEYRYANYDSKWLDVSPLYAAGVEEKQSIEREQTLRIGAAYYF